MAITVSNRKQTVFGDRAVIFCDITFDSSYPTGGESFAPSDIGLHNFDHIDVPPASGYFFEYDWTNQKIKAYSGDQEVTNGQDLSSVTTKGVMIVGW